MNDRRCYFFFAGYHTVAAAADVLTRYHIASRIVKAPIRLRNSCSFAVVTDAVDEKMTIYVLERENIPIRRIEYAVQQKMI